MISCKELGVDVETYSETEIKNGAYAYADAPTFEIILIAYSLDFYSDYHDTHYSSRDVGLSVRSILE